jgi:hypothetical protein
MAMNINLKRRYPNSRTEDITDALRALLDATIDGGEAPAHEVTDQASR